MKTILSFCVICLLAAGCKPSDPVSPSATDFLPLEVGNYWKVDDENYVEVTGTETINNQAFFVLRSRHKEHYNPGLQDVNLYFRIDERANLIQGYKNSTFTSTIANFRLAKGQKVETSFNTVVNDKTADRITFRYDCIHCAAANTYYYATFISGKGFAERNFMLAGSLSLVKKFTEAKIGGKVYKL